MGMVLPEELLYVQYASELREYLLKNFNQIIISPANNNKFWDAQQSPIILLADKSLKGKKGLYYIQYSDLISNRYDQIIKENNLSFIGNKWSHLLLEKTEIKLLNNVINKLNWKSLSEYGTVCIGVVTGKNDYFILNESESKNISDEYLKKIICNAKDLKGIKFTENDFENLVTSERPTYLLSINNEYGELPENVKTYLKKGEELNVHKGYKCSIRDQWFSVPSAYDCDAFFLRQSGKIPRIVNSELPCTCTDTLHRIKWKDKSYGNMLSLEFLNSLTLISCNLLGRSYGGGVLTVLPSEANNLLVPKPINSILNHEQYIDELIRGGKIWDAILFIDHLILDPILDKEEIISLEKILKKLIDRRAKK
jgi:adenine-specific DNA-methyltransferase